MKSKFKIGTMYMTLNGSIVKHIEPINDGGNLFFVVMRIKDGLKKSRALSVGSRYSTDANGAAGTRAGGRRAKDIVAMSIVSCPSKEQRADIKAFDAAYSAGYFDAMQKMSKEVGWMLMKETAIAHDRINADRLSRLRRKQTREMLRDLK